MLVALKNIIATTLHHVMKIQKRGISKERSKRQNCKFCRLDLIEPVHARYLKVQVTVCAPVTGLAQFNI
jgi:hypothetical protein